MAEDTRERILEAACDLIASDGIDEVRIARVAMKAGASTALVHHYFSTREELLEQALIHSFGTAGDERFTEEPESPTAGDRLAKAIRDCLPLPGPQEREWVLWVELWLRPVAAELDRRYREWLAAAIRAGVESGEFAADIDVDTAADLAMALLDGAGIRALIDDPAMDVTAARDLVVGQLAGVLGVDPERLSAPVRA